MRVLFEALKNAGYDWTPQTPDRLLSFRKAPEPFRPLVQLFGLGLPVAQELLAADGLPESAFRTLVFSGLVWDATQEAPASNSSMPVYKAAMAISGSNDLFIAHDHWPPSVHSQDGYVHCAAESAWLARQLQRDLEGFIDKRVLDLGCSSGVLSFEVAVIAREVLGLDISKRSVEWARLISKAYGFRNTRFEVTGIGSPEAEALVGEAGAWDCVVMNPPMVVPAKDASYPHRDGGKLGMELPLLFLDFAYRHLRAEGEVQTFVTNPILRGRSAFFDMLDPKRWKFIEKRCLHSHFNQTVARKQGYAEQGIERIELWFLHLKKR